MTHEGLEFLHADPAHDAWRSPLRRALAAAPAEIRDVSAEVDAETVAAFGPTAGVAGIELEAPRARQLLRRLTDLDLDALPAIGAVARIRGLVAHEDGDRYRIWFPQEYSDYVAAVVLDAWAGLA